MAENSDDLERLSREQLILKARVLGVERPELMTRVEMRDEIVRRSEPDLAQQKRARGFLGVARDLVASVVEAGLNLPDAAALIRGDNREIQWKGPPPVATVTLAEIYAAQGHLDRALRMLDEVLAKEPDHDPARALRTRLASATDLPVAPARRRQKISFVENPSEHLSADVPPAAPVEAPEQSADQAAEPRPNTALEPDLAANAASPEPITVAAPAVQPSPTIDTAPAIEPEPAPAPEAHASVESAAAVEPEPAPAPDANAAAEPAPAPEVASLPVASEPLAASTAERAPGAVNVHPAASAAPLPPA